MKMQPNRSQKGCIHEPAIRLVAWFRAHSCLHFQEFASHQPQIGQREQRVQLRGVLGQSTVAQLEVSELALDDPELVLDLGADAGLEALNPFGS